MNLREERRDQSLKTANAMSASHGFVAALLVVLIGTTAAHAAKGAPSSSWKLSPATVSVLEIHALKRVASKDPVEAIHRLDELRAVEAAPEIDLAGAEIALRAGLQAAPGEAVGLLLRAASETYPRTLGSASGSETSRIHTRATEGLIVSLQQPGASVPDETVLETSGPLADWELTWLNADTMWAPETHEFIPATHYRTVKTKVEASRPGIGVPVVAWRKGGVPDPIVREGGIFPI